MGLASVQKTATQQPRQEAAGFVWDKKQEDVKILAALSYVLLAYGVVLSCPFRMLLMILGAIQVARWPPSSTLQKNSCRLQALSMNITKWQVEMGEGHLVEHIMETLCCNQWVVGTFKIET